MIAVDEAGAEAAAAAFAEIPVSKVTQVVMTVDRPFLFAILTRESGLIQGSEIDPPISWYNRG